MRRMGDLCATLAASASQTISPFFFFSQEPGFVGYNSGLIPPAASMLSRGFCRPSYQGSSSERRVIPSYLQTLSEANTVLQSNNPKLQT